MSAVPERTRASHVAWCKKRALEYVETGDLKNTVASMISDMHKHPLTDTPILSVLMMAGIDAARSGSREVRDWIEGFN